MPHRSNEYSASAGCGRGNGHDWARLGRIRAIIKVGTGWRGRFLPAPFVFSARACASNVGSKKHTWPTISPTGGCVEPAAWKCLEFIKLRFEQAQGATVRRRADRSGRSLSHVLGRALLQGSALYPSAMMRAAGWARAHPGQFNLERAQRRGPMGFNPWGHARPQWRMRWGVAATATASLRSPNRRQT